MTYRYQPQNWSQLSALIDSALELPEEQRLSWLESLPAEHAALKPQLREFLTSADHARRLLDTPPDVIAALHETSQSAAQFQTELQPDKLVGSYQLIRELGHGGMGSVWLARRVDGKFNREVALKFPYAGPRQRQLAERLIRERNILGSLQHTNIARLYDADVTPSGQPFLVLEYIDGIAINLYCDQRKLDIRARLALFQQVLSAVRYAHTHLVIHRDIKPSNILITSDGVAHLLDFGIATSIVDGESHETPLTQFDGRVLTPEYASPEQLTKTAATTASDVYSLGVVLYELLTGVLPYSCNRDQRAQLEQAVAQADIVLPSRAMTTTEVAASRNAKPSQLVNTLRGELDTLLLGALKKNIEQRYASADAFHQDISRYLEHQPIHAQPDSNWYRIRKFTRRNRGVAASAGAVLMALIAGLGIALWQAHIANQQRDRAIALAARGEAIAEFMRLAVTEVVDADQPITIQSLLERSAKVAQESFADNVDQQVAILEVLGGYYMALHRSASARQAFDQALVLAKNGNDPELKARLLCGVGHALFQTGDTQGALTHLASGLSMAGDFPEVQVGCLKTRGYIAWEASDPAAMLDEVNKAQEILRSSGLNRPVLVAGLLADAASAELELGRAADAARDFALAFDQLERLGRGEQLMAMSIQSNWAGVDAYAGNPRGALEHIDKAREIAAKRGIGKDEGAGFTANRAAELYKLARYDEAIQEYRLGIDSGLKQHNVSDIAANKQGMSRVLLESGRITEAQREMRDVAAMLGKELPLNGSAARNQNLLGGMLALEHNDHIRAIELLSNNIDYANERKQANGSLISNLKLRAEAYAKANRLEDAMADATHGYELARTFQGEFRYSRSSGLLALTLARIEQQRDRSADAHRWVVIAYQQLQGSVGDQHPMTMEAKHLLDSLQSST